MSGTGFSGADRANGGMASNQIAEPTDFASVLDMNPALASLSAPPLALAQTTGTTGPTGLTTPPFNLFSTPTHPMNSSLGVGGLGPSALVAAVNAARASVEAAAIRPAMATAFPGSTPAAEFKENIRLALDAHLPRLEALARAVVEGMYVHSSLSSTPKPSGSIAPRHSLNWLPSEKAYHPQVNSNRTAREYLTASVYPICRGCGRLNRVFDSQHTEDLALLVQAIDMFYNFLKETGVGALPLLKLPSLEQDNTASVIANDLASTNDEIVKKKLDSLVDAQFAHQKRVKDRAGIVSNLLQRG